MFSRLADALLRTVLVLYPLRSGRKKLARFAARIMSRPMIWRMADGTLLLLDLRNYIDREVVTKGGFERENIEFFCARIAGYDAFLDVGANIGLYSLAVARRGAMRIVAFEPDPRNRMQMGANLFLNALDDRVDLRSDAVGPAAGEMTLYAQRDPHNFSTGRSSLVRADKDGIAVPVRIVALDDLFADWAGRRIGMKMDIEGFELHALAGMTNLFARNRVFLQIEITENLEAVRARLADFGMTELPQLHPGSADYYFESAPR